MTTVVKAFWHVRGLNPCNEIAFTAPLDFLDQLKHAHEAQRPPRAVAVIDPMSGVLQMTSGIAIFTCSCCGDAVNPSSLEQRDLPVVRRYVYLDRRMSLTNGTSLVAAPDFAQRRQRPDRRAIGRHAPDFRLDLGRDVTPGEIARAAGIPKHTIKEMCIAGEIEGAYRDHDTAKHEWRIKFDCAKRLLRRWNILRDVS